MPFVKLIFFCLLLVFFYRSSHGESSNENVAYKWPTVDIAILVRNKAHALPFFFTCLHNLDYPKDRLYIWIYSDFNSDNSIEVLEKWMELHASEYNGVLLTTNTSSGILHSDETRSTHWSPSHFKHVIMLREKALDFARKIWADYLFMLDADVFLTEKDTLKILVRKNMPVVAPMLISDGLYSNFWCGMSDKYYYQRTDEYLPILNREQRGCFAVPMIHTAVLISLTRTSSDLLTYNPKNIEKYDGPVDDIIAFALNSRKHDITLEICNDHFYGYVSVPLEDIDDPKNDLEQLLNIKLEAISRHAPLPVEEAFQKLVTYPQRWKFGIGEIYLINLERRHERRKLMELSFRELGMDVKLVRAVDGRNLDMKNLRRYSVRLMPNYEDPYHKRPIKAGEIGCFLSHYSIWKEMIENDLPSALVLEDDVHFAPYFRQRLLQLLHEIERVEWDLVYIGRKILQDSEEVAVTLHTTRPLYSYWTLGYLISHRGAEKLLAANPLSNLLPVDEFLPIMFDQHPNATWKSYFPNRNLVALSASPLLIEPTHYTGQDGYVSDTEDSNLVDESIRTTRNEL